MEGGVIAIDTRHLEPYNIDIFQLKEVAMKTSL